MILEIGHRSATARRDQQARCRRPVSRRGLRASHRSERGLVLMAVLGMVAVLTLFGALAMSVAGREVAMSGMRYDGVESLYLAEAGAVSGRAALMAYVGDYPTGVTTVDPALNASLASGWYANGVAANQDPFSLLNYLQIDGQELSVTAPAAAEAFQVNWALAYPHLKLQTTGSPVNTLGNGSYTATVTLTPNPVPDTVNHSCNPDPCAIHQLGPNWYEIFYNFTVSSIGTVSPKFRREVVYSGSFSVQLRLQNFSVYALFTNTHTFSSGTAVWFTNQTNFSGPVHTNDEFRFLQFPTFTGKLESVNTKAWYYNNGLNVELANNENVNLLGQRIDAPLVPPDPNPQTATPAAFTRGVAPIPLPNGPYNQQGVAIGLNPGNTSPVANGQIASAVPELNGSSSIPNGVYVPVVDTCSSKTGDNMGGGIYVQGNLDSLTMSVGGGSGNLAVYTFTQGSTTTTVTIDRTNNQTTVTSNNWLPPSKSGGCTGGAPGPNTRTFNGVPKGYQGPGNANATLIYVSGSVNSFSGTLQQNEQTTLATSGDITIQGNVLYQTPPNPSDPASNPTNLLGLYSSNGNIVIGTSAPNNVIIDAVLMAGSTCGTCTAQSQVYVANYDMGSPRGTANVLGGLIEKYYGPFGTVSGLGVQLTGYGRNFTYDTRMSRGFAPPYYPTTNLFQVQQGSLQMAGVKPVWREATPP